VMVAGCGVGVGCTRVGNGDRRRNQAARLLLLATACARQAGEAKKAMVWQPRLQVQGCPPSAHTLCPSPGNSPGSSVRVTRRRQRLWRLTCRLRGQAAAGMAGGIIIIRSSNAGHQQRRRTQRKSLAGRHCHQRRQAGRPGPSRSPGLADLESVKPEQGEAHLPGAVQLGGLALAARHALHPGGAHPLIAAQVGEPDQGVLLVAVVVGSGVDLQLSPGPC
jgi:hypothetical protein